MGPGVYTGGQVEGMGYYVFIPERGGLLSARYREGAF